MLARFRDDGHLPRPDAVVEAPPLRLVGDAALRLTADSTRLEAELRRHLARSHASGYLGLQAYVAPSPRRDDLLAEIRLLLRDGTRLATTLGYGPRFLHSTGQLHKGGPRTGCFIQLLAAHREDVRIPGEQETFGTLIDAQALGDFASLEGHDLPVARVELGDDVETALAALRDVLALALERTG